MISSSLIGPRGPRATDPRGEVARESLRCVNGAIEQNLPLSGRSVAWVRANLRDSLIIETLTGSGELITRASLPAVSIEVFVEDPPLFTLASVDGPTLAYHQTAEACGTAMAEYLLVLAVAALHESS